MTKTTTEAQATTYRIQAKTETTPWQDEGSGDSWVTREAAESVMAKLERTNEDGRAIEYRVVEHVS